MTPSLRSVFYSLTYPTDSFFNEEHPPGKLQYFGAHFYAVIRYALKWSLTNKDDTFTIGFITGLDDSYVETMPLETYREYLLDFMASSLIGIKEFFTIQKIHQYSSDTTVHVVESFIEFLVDVLEGLSSSTSCSWIIIPDQINTLFMGLKFLIVFLQEIPFQITDLKESKNVFVEIESVANEAGIFLHSFLFTTDDVTMTKFDLELSLLISKLEVVEEKIKEHCLRIKVFEYKKFTTPNLTSASIYIVDSVLDDLNHLLNHEADLTVEVKGQITTLHEILYSSRSMLRDIQLQENKELTECREMQLIDLAYQVEYIIVCFMTGEVPVWYLALRIPNFIWKSESIRDSLVNIKPFLDISSEQVEESFHEVSSSQAAPKSILMADEIIVGFDKKKREITNQLLGGPDRLQIISIIGMGGIGKTTLVRMLYNDSHVLRRFDKRSWCVVSNSYEKRKLLIDILSSISSLHKNELSKMEDHQLADRVHKGLKGTRYLLVVDDIWEKEAWDDLKRYFPNDRNGSKIVFTSRNKDVALQDSSEPIIHDLPLLCAHECWDLLQKKVFSNSDCPQELEDIGKEIASNCKGLPLVVVGIAAVLANMDKKVSSWKEVATNLSSYISKDQDVLELSYEHLPSHLKPCFLYLAIFGEDVEIRVRKLLSLWVSQGLIPKNEDKISEDVAEDYLLELINRSMVQVTKRRSDNGVKTFTMHDLIRDMCVRLADKENFLQVIKGEFSTIDQHHHICIQSNVHEHDFLSKPVGPCIRSLFSKLSVITSSMKRLRILRSSTFATAFSGGNLNCLVQLRHLECDKSLPDIGSHMKLEFLSVDDPLEDGIQLNMPKLRHLYLSEFSCVPFKFLNISQTDSLQTLSEITICDLEDEERLRSFSNIRYLKCNYGESWDEGSLDLSSLTHLVSLNIRCDDFITLKAINFPMHIKKLTLCRMEFGCGLLSSIGTLPHLEILKLFSVIFEERSWNTNYDEFQKLKYLKINRVGLEEWNIAEDHFPSLEQLVLVECFDLVLLPSELGYIPTLERIEVYDGTQRVRNSAKLIEEEQEEAGNEQLQVIISGTYNGE